ncbi:MAG: sigma-70 family RNA polymerase sigma factor [Chloroflexi bacterium]|nr:sigma-70 family RNA polymerase sigma factor [Chloroflexota bacterium]
MIGALQIAGRLIHSPLYTDRIVLEDSERSRAAIALHALDRKDAQSPDSAREMVDSTELTRRLQLKDPDALEQLYELLSGRAFGLAYRVLSDGAAAEDVVQEAFLWIWNNPERINASRGRVESLLLTIVHRRAIDAARSRSRRDALGTEMDDNLIDEDASDLFDSVAERMSSDEVRKRVDLLSDEQKQVIELAYFGGMTHSEISDEIGIPLGTVKSRLRLGMDKLRISFGLGGSA